jgi:LEA14-like dessication related protein
MTQCSPLTAAFLMTSLLLGGCQEAEPFLPKVKFERFDIKTLSWADISTDFVFAVTNPNPIKVGVDTFNYDFDLADTDLLDGDNANGFKLKAEGTSDLTLPVDLVFAETWETVQATRGLDDVPFRLAGEFGFDTPLGMVNIPYDEDGDFPALRTPKFQFKGLRVADVSLTNATLELELGVDNDHGSTLFFDNFGYGITLAGADVASGLVQTFDVLGSDEGTVTLPIDINILTAGVTLADALFSGGDLPVGLVANMDVDTPFGILPLAVDQSGDVLLELLP